MGYDLERFVGYVNEGLLCCICRDVLEDPLQSPCEHAFCTSCIQGWLVHCSNCPEDRLPLDLSSLRPLFRYMKNDLNRLQLHCKDKEHGCEMVCSLESIDRHERKCKYSQIPCSNAGCPVQVERGNLSSHLAECEYQSRECPNGCGCIILGAEGAQHTCVAEQRTEPELPGIRLITVAKVWNNEEVQAMLEFIRIDGHSSRLMSTSSANNNTVYVSVAQHLSTLGIVTSPEQTRCKFKCLKSAFCRSIQQHGSERTDVCRPQHFLSMKLLWEEAGRPKLGRRRSGGTESPSTSGRIHNVRHHGIVSEGEETLSRFRFEMNRTMPSRTRSMWLSLMRRLRSLKRRLDWLERRRGAHH